MASNLRLPFVLFVAVALAWTAVYMGLADGGAPLHAELGVESAEPELEAWSLINASGVVCSHLEACPPAPPGECMWEGLVWLSSAGNPAVLRSVQASAWVVGWTGERENSTGFEATGKVHREDGAWLRAVAERVFVDVPIPCDTDVLRLSVNVSGRKLGGDAWASSQSLELRLR